ncbi:MAG: hypothetical protein WBN82_11030 [Porticoccaceae bacterium]
MAFDWAEFLAFSERLYARADRDEATERTIISRAYYSAFGIARTQLGDRVAGRQSIHKKVIDTYKNSDDRNERQLGSKLDSLRLRRVKADYETNYTPENNTERALQEARGILRQLGEFSL